MPDAAIGREEYDRDHRIFERGYTSAVGVHTKRVMWLLMNVATELDGALAKFPPFNSPHEGKAVIEEELDELWEHVKANTGRGTAAYEEALQVAAMALRYAHDLMEWGPGYVAA
jgi:hypothetical protein